MLGFAGVGGLRHVIGGLVLLIVGLLLLGGCNPLAGASGAKTYSTSNDLVEFSRTVPEQVQAGSVFTVQVVLKAKVALQMVAVTEQLPVGFISAVPDQPLTALGSSLKPGDQVKLSYRIQASSEAKTFQLWGRVRALPPGKDSVTLILGSPVKVTH